MATYKVVMRPALGYASSVWSPIASSTSINKLQPRYQASGGTSVAATGDLSAGSLVVRWWLPPKDF